MPIATAAMGTVTIVNANGETNVYRDVEIETAPLDFKSGTRCLNLTGDYLSLDLSTTKVAAHSILTFTTDKGTWVTLSGRIDKAVK